MIHDVRVYLLGICVAGVIFYAFLILRMLYYTQTKSGRVVFEEFKETILTVIHEEREISRERLESEAVKRFGRGFFHLFGVAIDQLINDSMVTIKHKPIYMTKWRKKDHAMYSLTPKARIKRSYK